MTEGQPVDKRSRKLYLLWAIALTLLLLAATLGGMSWLHHVKFNTRRKTCAGTQLRDIALSCEVYAEDNGGVFPSALGDLGPEYLCVPAEKILSCPGAHAAGRPRPHYAIEPGLRKKMPPEYIMLYDASLDNHERCGRNVVLLDQGIQWWPVSRELEFQEKLSAQRKAIKKIKAAQEKKP